MFAQCFSRCSTGQHPERRLRNQMQCHSRCCPPAHFNPASIAPHRDTKPGWKRGSPAEFNGGVQHKGVHTAVACLDSEFCQNDFRISLDMQKCFDFVSPRFACEVLRKLGFPDAWASAIDSIWCHQRRWLQLFDTTLSKPIRVGSFMPQGDGLAPLALNAVMSGLFRAHQGAMRSAGFFGPNLSCP